MRRIVNTLSELVPLQRRKVGYPGTGFVFWFYRCRDRKTLRDAVVQTTGVQPEVWFDAGFEESIPNAFTVVTASNWSPDEWPEATPNGDLASAHLFSVCAEGIEGGNAESELCHWFHECGHATVYLRRHYVDFWGENASADDIVEFPAFCNELMCQVSCRMVAEDYASVKSGFLECFRWLKLRKDGAVEKPTIVAVDEDL